MSKYSAKTIDLIELTYVKLTAPSLQRVMAQLEQRKVNYTISTSAPSKAAPSGGDYTYTVCTYVDISLAIGLIQTTDKLSLPHGTLHAYGVIGLTEEPTADLGATAQTTPMAEKAGGGH